MEASLRSRWQRWRPSRLQRTCRTQNPLSPKTPHFPPKAKRVILLWMQGGPSQMDLFDYKPRLKSEAGNQVPFKLNSNDVRFEKSARLMPSVAEFKQTGQSGMWVSDMMPRFRRKGGRVVFPSRAADRQSGASGSHSSLSKRIPAVCPPFAGFMDSVWAWEPRIRICPGFVVISPMLYGDDGSTLDFSNVFLPAVYQGTRIGDARTPVKESKIGYLSDPNLPSEFAAPTAGSDSGSQSDGSGSSAGGSQHRRPDSVLRTCVPHADGSAFRPGLVEGIEGNA